MVAEVLGNRLELYLFDHINSGSIQIFVNELLKLLLEPIKGYDDASDVVDCPSESSCSENTIDTMAAVVVGLLEVNFLNSFFISFHQDLLPSDVNCILA